MCIHPSVPVSIPVPVPVPSHSLPPTSRVITIYPPVPTDSNHSTPHHSKSHQPFINHIIYSLHLEYDLKKIQYWKTIQTAADSLKRPSHSSSSSSSAIKEPTPIHPISFPFQSYHLSLHPILSRPRLHTHPNTSSQPTQRNRTPSHHHHGSIISSPTAFINICRRRLSSSIVHAALKKG